MKKAASLKIADWSPRAESTLAGVLRKAASLPGLKRRLRARGPWRAEVRLVGSSAMKRLNGEYRGKSYATDVLSFPAPEVFRSQGLLGELVVCLPTLARQARERGHEPQAELRVLLTHGVLHLLGMDHELGAREAAEMARWEAKLLPARLRGLIDRVSGD